MSEYRTDLLAPELAGLDFTPWMREALAEAEAAGQAGDRPIGAVLVVDGQIVARGRARQQQDQSQVSHAELNAFLQGGTPLWERYEHGIIVTTVEPCPLCLGATVMADIPHIIFALHDEVVQSRQIVATVPYVRRHIRTYYGGVLQDESRALFERYDPATLRYIRPS